MTTTNNIILVFDLDDTLYKEIDFLKSAYRDIAYVLADGIEADENKIFNTMLDFYFKDKNAFALILEKYNIKKYTIRDLISIYRNHYPEIQLSHGDKTFLWHIKDRVAKTGLITDGRSIQQRNKLKALGLENYFDTLIISEEFGSEKPNPANYSFFEERYKKNMTYIYVGDNTRKDFITPNTMGWHSICLLDNGNNIHKQHFDLSPEYLPKQRIHSLSEIAHTINQLMQSV